MKRITTLGEIMLRLKPPHHERFFQSPQLEVTFGGGEANTAVSLAQFGLDVSYVTALPNNLIGDACIRYLRGFGVDTSPIARSGNRMGLYFLEAGANQRPSHVIYDREGSSMATVKLDCFDWDTIFKGASWLHIIGITAAISQSAADLALTAVQKANEQGMTVSCDTSYRSKLWQYGKAPSDIMPQIAQYVEVIFANLIDCDFSYGVSLTSEESKGKTEDERNVLIAEKMFNTFPCLQYQLFTHREGFSASHNAWSASLFNGRSLYKSKRYDMPNIIDRVGGGDAFAAGIIYGLFSKMDNQKTLDFAAAAACLKHSIPGDVNLSSKEEIIQFMNQGDSGRVQR